MLQVEAPDVGAPQQAKVRLDPFWTMPPQPQLLGLSPPLGARQPLHLHQDERPYPTMGKGPRLPLPSCTRTFGCSFEKALTRTDP
jgi:hypothetical protein